MKQKALIFNLGFLMVLLLAIALVSISFILSPTKVHTRVGDYELSSAPGALSYNGLMLRVEAWKEYPQYNIGLGVVAGLSLFGAVYACRLMYSLKERQNDAPQSKSRAG